MDNVVFVSIMFFLQVKNANRMDVFAWSFAGGNPNRKDYGQGLCAEEWARFCGRINCADAIAKYIKSKNYFFKKTFMMTREKWNSEPDLKVHLCYNLSALQHFMDTKFQ